MKFNKCICFIVEGKSDKIYIDKLLKLKYKNFNNISVKYGVSNGKGNLKKIYAKAKKDYNPICVIVFDTDNITENNKNNNILDFCNNNNLKYIFFNENIEKVLLKNKIEKTSKMIYAKNYKPNF